MEITEVSVGQRIAVGETTLLPIIRTSVICRSVNRGVVGSGSKSLIGIVVVSPKRKYAINLDGEEVPLEQYLEQAPQVKKLLESM